MIEFANHQLSVMRLNSTGPRFQPGPGAFSARFDKQPYPAPAQKRGRVVATCETQSGQLLSCLFDNFQSMSLGDKEEFDSGLLQARLH
jgi:hypothetical protein